MAILFFYFDLPFEYIISTSDFFSATTVSFILIVVEKKIVFFCCFVIQIFHQVRFGRTNTCEIVDQILTKCNEGEKINVMTRTIIFYIENNRIIKDEC